MAQNFPGTIYDIFGNNADPEQQQIAAADFPNIFLLGERGGFTVEGIRIGCTHFPQVAEAMVTTGEFDLVCHGHTHLKRWEKKNSCYILNPGTAGGVFQYPSFATVDLPDMKARFIDLRF
jgi:predicted phosphodiesterase